MTGVVVDTSVLVDAERGALELSVVQADATEPLVMSAISAHELLRGLARLPAGVRRARSERWIEGALAKLTVIEYDLEIARVHAAMCAEMSAARVSLTEFDQIIAATAISLGYDLATRDAVFKRVPELKLRAW